MKDSVSTDAALAVHGLTDQPIPTITVIMPRPVPTPFQLGKPRVGVSRVSEAQFRRADHYSTTIDGSGWTWPRASRPSSMRSTTPGG